MEGHLEKAIRYLLKSAFECEEYAATLDPDKDEEVIVYFSAHSQLLRTLANDWDEPDSQGNIVQFPGHPTVSPLPEENRRRDFCPKERL